MMKKFLHGSMIAATGIMGGLLAAGDLTAQDPKVPAPAGITPRSAPPPIQARPITQPRPKSEVELRGNLAPDLELSFTPTSGAAPSRFTVVNSGLGDARDASLLRVSVRLLPLEEEGRRALRLPLDAFAPGDEVSERFASWCAIPYPDFQAAIDPLDAGETHAVTQSGARVGEGIVSVGMAAARPATRVRDHSYVRQIEIRLVCVYELQATVDANGEIDESNERNNEVVHTFQREVTLR